MRWPVGAIIIGLGAMAFAPALAAERVPVRVGGEARYDACAGTSTVVGLTRGSGHTLNVRAGPGLSFPAVDALKPHVKVIVCDAQGEWRGIVYPAGTTDCETGSPIPRRVAYAGPCRSGWVHSRYLG